MSPFGQYNWQGQVKTRTSTLVHQNVLFFKEHMPYSVQEAAERG